MLCLPRSPPLWPGGVRTTSRSIKTLSVLGGRPPGSQQDVFQDFWITYAIEASDFQQLKSKRPFEGFIALISNRLSAGLDG
jgi:hypothetical protein